MVRATTRFVRRSAITALAVTALLTAVHRRLARATDDLRAAAKERFADE